MKNESENILPEGFRNRSIFIDDTFGNTMDTNLYPDNKGKIDMHRKPQNTAGPTKVDGQKMQMS